MSARKLILLAAVFFFTLWFACPSARPQIVIRPRAEEEIILATPDVQPKTPDKAAQVAEPLKTFNQVLWDDLKFSGYFTMAGKSFYPPQPVVRPEDLNYDAWNGLPFKVSFLTAGTMDVVGGILTAELRVFDMRQRTMAFGQVIRGDAGSREDSPRFVSCHGWLDFHFPLKWSR